MKRPLPPDVARVDVRVVMLDPRDAADLLTANSKNRPIDAGRVGRYKADILAGDWDFNGDTICISSENELLDGQHRLAAIVAAGVSVPVILVWGLDPSVVDTIDQIRPRSVGNILQFRGVHVEHASSVIAAATVLLRGDPAGGSSPRRVAIADYVQSNLAELTQWAAWAKKVAGESPPTAVRGQLGKRILSPAPLTALALHMAREGADPDMVREFFEGLAFGLTSNEVDRHNFAVIRKRLINTAPLITPGSGSYAWRLMGEFAVLIRAYNRHVKRERILHARISSENREVRTFAELPKPLRRVDEVEQ